VALAGGRSTRPSSLICLDCLASLGLFRSMPTASYYIGYTFPGGACRNPKTKSNWNASMGFAGTMLGVNKRVSIPPRLSLLAPVIKCVLSFSLQHRSRYEPHPSACRRFRMALSIPAIRVHNRNANLLREVNLSDIARARLDVLQTEAEENR
jgi:hypothetical protein